MRLRTLALLGLALLLTIVPIILVKFAAQDPEYGWILMVAAILIDMALIISYYFIFKEMSLGIGYSVIKAVSIVVIVIVSMILFSEKLTWYGYIGIGLIILGILLV